MQIRSKQEGKEKKKVSYFGRSGSQGTGRNYSDVKNIVLIIFWGLSLVFVKEKVVQLRNLGELDVMHHILNAPERMHLQPIVNAPTYPNVVINGSLIHYSVSYQECNKHFTLHIVVICLSLPSIHML